MRDRKSENNQIDQREIRERGFTLLEVMAVMAILLVLIALGVARYVQAEIHAREAALSTDLDEINQAIQEYTRDKAAAPTSLDDLVHSDPPYLGKIPVDPMTGAADWVPDNCSDLLSTDQLSTGICHVHSASNKSSPFNNKPYSEWDPD